MNCLLNKNKKEKIVTNKTLSVVANPQGGLNL